MQTNTPFHTFSTRLNAKSVSPSKRDCRIYDKYYKHNSFVKLKHIQNKDFMDGFNHMIEENNVELLNKIPQLKNHVKN